MPESSETPHDYASLAPSQALGSQTMKNKKKNNNKNNKNKKNPPQSSNSDLASSSVATASPPAPSKSVNNNSNSNNNNSNNNNRRRQNNSRKNDRSGEDTKTTPHTKQQQQQLQLEPQQQPTTQPTTQPAKNQKKKRKRYRWRRFIPDDTVDPITLESLKSLEYPPFALMANAPYDPVPVWPIPENIPSEGSEQKSQPKVNIEELNRQRIAEQWGTKFLNGDVGTAEGNDTSKEHPANEEAVPGPVDSSTRHFNLYDGRALAYYIVSQLQFIDPLNRRDLTRPELLNLDVYLRRHGFQDVNVTEAYDAKGVTISSAGAAATTAQGRADIMQQLARNLLNSLFGGQSVSAPPRPTQNSVQEQYAALQLQEQQYQLRPRGRNGGQQHQQAPGTLNPDAAPFSGGFYASEDGGLIVIDDDENIGMRGGDYSASRGNNQTNSLFTTSGASSSGINQFYSASHITARHGSGRIARSSTDEFPELPTAATATSTNNVSAGPAATAAKDARSTNKPAAKPSKTLSRIAGAVKKTTPEEQHKHWRAREEALKRAMMSNMYSGIDASGIGSTQQHQGLPFASPILSTASPQVDVSEEKLLRNKAFADALGVKPATLRQNINSGWARPTVEDINLNEFGNELNAAIYADSLLLQARDRMSLVLKVEKKWRAFLEDDKAASLPLNPMDRPTRAFVHQYSDFWNLKTESFDPEPRRYIHCVKLLETHMPRPLLSDAARKWRGPAATVDSVFLADLPRGPALRVPPESWQTAGEPSKSRELVPPPERLSLPVQPRSLPIQEQSQDTNTLRVAAFDGNDGYPPADGRFVSLLGEKERPKITLAKRTVPLELPPFQPETTEFNSEAEIQQRLVRMAEKERNKKEAEERKRRAIEDAFASDDEDGDKHDDKDGDAASAGSDWDEPEALYQGSDRDE